MNRTTDVSNVGSTQNSEIEFVLDHQIGQIMAVRKMGLRWRKKTSCRSFSRIEMEGWFEASPEHKTTNEFVRRSVMLGGIHQGAFTTWYPDA